MLCYRICCFGIEYAVCPNQMPWGDKGLLFLAKNKKRRNKGSPLRKSQVSFTGGETIHPVLAFSSIAGIASYTFFIGPMRVIYEQSIQSNQWIIDRVGRNR